MTPADREAVLSLTRIPTGDRERSAGVLQHFGAPDGAQLAFAELRDAAARRDQVDVEMALILGFVFGFIPEETGLLNELLSADWHFKHEDIVRALVALKASSPDVIEALYQATQWIPEYLDHDEGRALAVKAIHGLGKIPGPDAERALTRLLSDPDAVINKNATRQLQRRRENMI